MLQLLNNFPKKCWSLKQTNPDYVHEWLSPPYVILKRMLGQDRFSMVLIIYEVSMKSGKST